MEENDSAAGLYDAGTGFYFILRTGGDIRYNENEGKKVIFIWLYDKKFMFFQEGDMLESGSRAPEFELPDQNGVLHKLSDYRGQKVILYFYPRDNTAGCSKQACSFGELYPQFQEKGAVVLGVSKDTVKSHKRFEEKFGLPFTLLSDTEKTVLQAYDVWKEKKMYGKVSMGVVRSTYLIDEEGIIIRAFGKVKAADNPGQMLAELEKLQ